MDYEQGLGHLKMQKTVSFLNNLITISVTGLSFCKNVRVSQMGLWGGNWLNNEINFNFIAIFNGLDSNQLFEEVMLVLQIVLCWKTITDNLFPNMLSMNKRYERNREFSFLEEGGPDKRVGFSNFGGMGRGLGAPSPGNPEFIN